METDARGDRKEPATEIKPQSSRNQDYLLRDDDADEHEAIGSHQGQSEAITSNQSHLLRDDDADEHEAERGGVQHDEGLQQVRLGHGRSARYQWRSVEIRGSSYLQQVRLGHRARGGHGGGGAGDARLRDHQRAGQVDGSWRRPEADLEELRGIFWRDWRSAKGRGTARGKGGEASEERVDPKELRGEIEIGGSSGERMHRRRRRQRERQTP